MTSKSLFEQCLKFLITNVSNKQRELYNVNYNVHIVPAGCRMNIAHWQLNP